MDFEDKIFSWGKKFWFLRGALTALTILALLPSYLNVAQWELAKGILSIIFGWNIIMEATSKIINNYIPILSLTKNQLNAIILIFSIMVPAALGMRRVIRIVNRRRPGEIKESMAMRGLIFIAVCYIQYEFTQYLLPGRNRRSIASDTFYDNLDAIPLIWLFPLSMFLFSFYLACRLSKGYWKGFVFFSMFLFTVNIVFYLPIIGKYLKVFSDLVVPAET